MACSIPPREAQIHLPSAKESDGWSAAGTEPDSARDMLNPVEVAGFVEHFLDATVQTAEEFAALQRRRAGELTPGGAASFSHNSVASNGTANFEAVTPASSKIDFAAQAVDAPAAAFERLKRENAAAQTNEAAKLALSGDASTMFGSGTFVHVYDTSMDSAMETTVESSFQATLGDCLEHSMLSAASTAACIGQDPFSPGHASDIRDKGEGLWTDRSSSDVDSVASSGIMVNGVRFPTAMILSAAEAEIARRSSLSAASHAFDGFVRSEAVGGEVVLSSRGAAGPSEAIGRAHAAVAQQSAQAVSTQ